ncbi:hypothetical protein ACFQZE_10275 [Paenibacillus sp. GCM10027627]
MMYDDPTGHMPKWLKKAAKVTFKVAKFAVLDDIMTLANPKASLGQKILAGVSLLPASKIIKVAQVAIKVTKTVKATNAVAWSDCLRASRDLLLLVGSQLKML